LGKNILEKNSELSEVKLHPHFSLPALSAIWFLDDSMTILMAFEEPSVEIIGLTTIFGNVTTEYATRNALLLVSIGHC
jgi:hypothetical protein